MPLYSCAARTAETGSSIAVVGACREGACREGGINSIVGIGGRAGIGASSDKDAFRPSRVPLLLQSFICGI